MACSGTPAPEVYDRFSLASSADPSSRGPNPTRYDKDVGRCTVHKELDEQGRETILEIDIENGYPSYWCTAHAFAINTGTTLVQLQDINLIGVAGGGDQPIREGELWCVDTDDVTPAELAEAGPICREVDGDVLTSSLSDFDIMIDLSLFGDCFVGVLLAPSPDANSQTECPLAVHVEQGSQQDDTQVFQMEMLWVQDTEFVPDFAPGTIFLADGFDEFPVPGDLSVNSTGPGDGWDVDISPDTRPLSLRDSR